MTWELALAVWLGGALVVFACALIDGFRGASWRAFRREQPGAVVHLALIVVLLAFVVSLLLWPLDVAYRVFALWKKGREA